MTGKVERVAHVTPRSIVWEGKVDEVLDTNIMITPSEKYPFSIIEMKQRPDSKIVVKLVEPEKTGQPWQVNVKCSSETADSYYDSLVLKTDSPYMKKISVRVYATFIEETPITEN